MTGIVVRKSYKAGHVSVRIALKAHSYRADTIKIEGQTDLSSTDAREIATALIEEADRADARVAAKAASDERRQKWRDREIAAGRIKIISPTDFFGNRR